MTNRKPHRYDHEIIFEDEVFEDKPFVTADGKKVYAHCSVLVSFDVKEDSCDYPNNTRQEWTEVDGWKAEIDIGDVSAYDDHGEPVEVTEEMRKFFEDQFDIDEGHEEKMLKMAEDAADSSDDDRRYNDDY